MQLYCLKISIFIEEIFSVIFTPFVLWFSLPKCSDRIIDFFREFTVHVDGVGYVCSFAVFNFQQPDVSSHSTLGISNHILSDSVATKHRRSSCRVFCIQG